VDVLQFLIGLEPEYKSVRAQILGGTSIPSLPEGFSRIQKDTLPHSSSHISFDHSRESSDSNASRGSFDSSCGLKGVVVRVAVVHVAAKIIEGVIVIGVVSLRSVLIVAVVIIL
jgi:hypothetical protein